MEKAKYSLGVLGLLAGIIGGIAGTSFAMGAEKQRIHDALIVNTTKIAAVEETVDKEMDRYAIIMASQITALQEGVNKLTSTVGDLRIDVGILTALMERMEGDIRARNK